MPNWTPADVLNNCTIAQDTMISTRDLYGTEGLRDGLSGADSGQAMGMSLGSGLGLASALSGTGSASAVAQSLAAYAETFVGKVPYVLGGTSPITGWDCSGMVQTIFAHFGRPLLRTAAEQGAASANARLGALRISTTTALQPGDRVYFSEQKQGTVIGHAGIYVGNGYLVDAEHPGAGTGKQRISSSWYAERFIVGWRDFPSTGAVAAGLAAVSSTADMRALVVRVAQATGIRPALFLALVQTESNFDPNARNPKSSAVGLCQLLTGTWRSLGITNPFDPTQNAAAGANYLKQQLTTFGTERLALAAYYDGPSAVKQHGPSTAGQQYADKILALANS